MKVILPAEVSEYSFGGWSIGLWVGEVFEEEQNAPLSRVAISELAECLGKGAALKVDFPDFDAWDIVAEGALDWRDWSYQLVVNTSDGVVAIQHSEREPLDALLSAIENDIVVATRKTDE